MFPSRDTYHSKNCAYHVRLAIIGPGTSCTHFSPMAWELRHVRAEITAFRAASYDAMQAPQQAQQTASPTSGTAKKRRKGGKGAAAAATPTAQAAPAAQGTPAAQAPEIVLLPHDHAAVVGWPSSSSSSSSSGPGARFEARQPGPRGGGGFTFHHLSCPFWKPSSPVG